MPIKNPENIKLNERHELEAIIGNPPGWALRWGMTVIFFGGLLLLLLSWMVVYPDIVEARVMLTTENPPIRVNAEASGKITELRVANGSEVEAGELLAILENPARLEDVEKLEAFLQQPGQQDGPAYFSADLPEQLQLGDLQSEYARFSKNYRDLQYFLRQDIHHRKIYNLQGQIQEIDRLNASLARQEAILTEEVKLARSNVMRDSTLLAQRSLSQVEYEQSQANYLRKKRELENLRSGAAQNSLRIRQLRADILDLHQSESDDANTLQLTVQSDIQQLQGLIDAWKQKWLIIAPISGEVALTNARSARQFVKAGEEVMTIVPGTGSGGIVARALLSYLGSGKVKEGMEAQIRLDGYPYQEYGVLSGRVARISPVPGQQGYELDIEVPDDLHTSYDKHVPFQQEMQGTARIITEERSLLLRIFEKFRSALEN